MNTLLTTLLEKKNSSLPVIFDLSKDKELKEFEQMISDGKVLSAVDDYEEELRELFAVSDPSKVYSGNFENDFKKYFDEIKEASPLWKQGKWVFYPWRAVVVHILDHDSFYKVRTARNKLLITEEEQEKFYEATIGIAGLSVGSNIALALTLQGGPRKIKLADMDRLALSNTNRVISGVDGLGLLKVEVTARKLYEINPYMEIELYSGGLNLDNIEKFFSGLDLVVDELDNLAIKYLIREHAMKKSIPVVMGADNGDNAVIDVERYDINAKTEYFHGRLGGDISYESLSGLDKFGIGKTITKHIGPENVTPRMQSSLLEMGKKIVSWPQLGGAAMLNGVAIAYCIRKILNNQSVIENRALISIDALLDPEFDSNEQKTERDKSSESFKKLFGL
jgi:hypothetical protein